VAKRKEFLETLRAKFPKAYRLAWVAGEDELGSLADLRSLPESKRELQAEKLVVYHEITRSGPDVAWERLGRALRRVRKEVARGDILRAFEAGKLGDALQRAGCFGRRSDDLREDGDKFYA
jgi:hypothetical protein